MAHLCISYIDNQWCEFSFFFLSNLTQLCFDFCTTYHLSTFCIFDSLVCSFCHVLLLYIPWIEEPHDWQGRSYTSHKITQFHRWTFSNDLMWVSIQLKIVFDSIHSEDKKVNSIELKIQQMYYWYQFKLERKNGTLDVLIQIYIWWTNVKYTCMYCCSVILIKSSIQYWLHTIG